ncbi:unnamed protein product, partial [Meganyctiphanes norvegica]
GVCSIWTLAMISADRCNIICRCLVGAYLTRRKALVMVLTTWTIAITAALPPFFGWGAYAPEGILDSCSFDYLTQDFNTKSYYFFIFIVDFCVPLLVIIISYSLIVKTVFSHEATLRAQAKRMNCTSLRTESRWSNNVEYRIAKTAVANISLWLFCWTPYAFITLQ